MSESVTSNISTLSVKLSHQVLKMRCATSVSRATLDFVTNQLNEIRSDMETAAANLAEFEARFLGAIEKRSFAERTMRYEDVRDLMEGARPAILEKVRNMGR